MGDSLTRALDYLGSHHLAYAGTFLALFLCGVAIPLPEEPILLAAGFVAYKYAANVWVLTACAMAGVMLGDLTIFTVGRRHGDWVFKSRLLHWLLPERRLARARRLYAEHGPKVVFFGRFIAGLRFVVFFTAGNLGVPVPTFFSFDFLAALIAVPLSVYAAYHFGSDIERAVRFARRSEWLVIGTIAAAVLLAALVRQLRGRRSGPPEEGGGAAGGETGGGRPFSESGRFSAEEGGAPGPARSGDGGR